MSRTRLGGRPASPTSQGEPRRTEPAPPLGGSETTFDRNASTTPQGDRPPTQSSPQSQKVNGKALLSAVVWPRRDWLLPS